MHHHPCHSGEIQDCNCGFSVWTPGLEDKCYVNDAFNLFGMEIERNRQIDEFITYLSQADDPNDPAWQRAAANAAGIWEFTSAEQEYIETEVAKRWQGVD